MRHLGRFFRQIDPPKNETPRIQKWMRRFSDKTHKSHVLKHEIHPFGNNGEFLHENPPILSFSF